jgi:Flp pilus assembly protein TadD
MVIRVRGAGAPHRALCMVGAAAAVLSLAGCSGGDAMKVPGFGLSTSALNVPERVDPPQRPISPADAKAARERLGEAATLAAARSDPRDVEATISAARILRKQGDRSGALALLDQAAGIAPNDARLLRDRGLLALELGAVARARDHLQQAVSSGSTDWQTHSALGTALAAGGKHQAAQQQFAEALKRSPENPVVLNNMALSLVLDGKRGEAEQVLRRAAVAKPGTGGDARVAQNLTLLGRIGEGRKAASKPAASSAPKQGTAPPTAVKDDRKAAAAPRPEVKTAARAD